MSELFIVTDVFSECWLMFKLFSLIVFVPICLDVIFFFFFWQMNWLTE